MSIQNIFFEKRASNIVQLFFANLVFDSLRVIMVCIDWVIFKLYSVGFLVAN